MVLLTLGRYRCFFIHIVGFPGEKAVRVLGIQGRGGEIEDVGERLTGDGRGI